jgi:hypothetical protein
VTRRALAVAALVAALAGAWPARGQTAAGDYDAASAAWNGLGTFVALARGLGFEVTLGDRLAWDAIGPGDALIVLYPTAGLEDDHVARFLANGGRLALGDDFGGAPAAFTELGLVRQPAVHLVATRYHDDDQDLPIAAPLAPEHPLAVGVEGLTTNHPALFTRIEGPTAVFGFAADEVVVAAGELGAGRYVALADPSVLINRMLELEGNLAFARNLLGFLARPGGRIVIVAGDHRLQGAPSRALDEARGVAGALGRLNGWLVGLSDYYLAADAMRVLAIALALIGGAVALRVLPGRARRDLDGGWTRVAASEPAVGPAEVLAGLARPDAGGGVLAALALRDAVERRLARALDLPDPLERSDAELRREVARLGRPVAAAFAPLLPRLRRLPSRAGLRWGAPVSRRDLDRLGAAVDRLYSVLPAMSRSEPPSRREAP